MMQQATMQLRNPLMSGLTFPPPGFPTAEAMAQFFACFQAAQQHAQQPPALLAQQQAVQQHAAQQQAAQQHAAQPPALLEQQHAQQYAAQQHAAQQHAAQQHTAQQHAAQQHAAQQHAAQQQAVQQHAAQQQHAQQHAAQQHAVQQHAAQQLAAQQHAVQQQASQQQAALLAQQQAAPAQPQDMPADGAQQPADVFTRAAPRAQPALEAPHEHSLLRVVLEQAAHQQQQLSVVQESLALLRARMLPLPETVLPSASVVPQSQTWLTQSWPAYATQTQPEGVRLQRGPSMHWDATVSPTGPRPWGGLVNQTTGTSVPQRVDAQPDGARPLRGLLTRWGSSAVDAIGPRTSRWGRPMDPITTGASVLPSRSLQRAVSFMSRTACRNGAGCDVDDCGFDHTPRSMPIVQAKNASPASRRSSPSAAATAKPRTATLKPSNKELPVPSAPSAKMPPTATKPGSAYIDGPLPSKTEHDAHRLVNAKSMAAFYEDLADKAVALAHAHGRWAARLENRIASAAASSTAPVAEADAVSPAPATAPARNTMAPIPRTKGTQRSDATAAAALLRAAAKAAEAERAQKERAATEERDRNDSAALAAAAAENDAAKAAAQATAHASEEKAAAEKVTAAATAAAATAAAATAAAALQQHESLDSAEAAADAAANAASVAAIAERAQAMAPAADDADSAATIPAPPSPGAAAPAAGQPAQRDTAHFDAAGKPPLGHRTGLARVRSASLGSAGVGPSAGGLRPLQRRSSVAAKITETTPAAGQPSAETQPPPGTLPAAAASTEAAAALALAAAPAPATVTLKAPQSPSTVTVGDLLDVVNANDENGDALFDAGTIKRALKGVALHQLLVDAIAIWTRPEINARFNLALTLGDKLAFVKAARARVYNALQTMPPTPKKGGSRKGGSRA